MLSKGAQAVVRGIRLANEGQVHDGYELMKNSTGQDLIDAQMAMDDQAVLASKFREIGKRHNATKNEPMGKLLARAAAADDADAKLLLASGVLDRRTLL
jgi:hypothetical protein